jgi:hypothetical protein
MSGRMPLGFASLPGPRQLGQESDPRLKGPHQIQCSWVLCLHPNVMSSDCSQTQGFLVPHLRGTQSF